MTFHRWQLWYFGSRLWIQFLDCNFNEITGWEKRFSLSCCVASCLRVFQWLNYKQFIHLYCGYNMIYLHFRGVINQLTWGGTLLYGDTATHHYKANIGIGDFVGCRWRFRIHENWRQETQIKTPELNMLNILSNSRNMGIPYSNSHFESGLKSDSQDASVAKQRCARRARRGSEIWSLL